MDIMGNGELGILIPEREPERNDYHITSIGGTFCTTKSVLLKLVDHSFKVGTLISDFPLNMYSEFILTVRLNPVQEMISGDLFQALYTML